MHMIKSILGIALLMGVPCASLAGTTMTDRADAVVVGEVSSGQQTGSHVSFMLRVDRALKGSIAPGTVVSVEWARAPVVSTPLQHSGEYGVWFLQAASTGAWHLLPATHSNAPIPLALACYPLPKGSVPSVITTAASPHDLVALELAAGLGQFDRRGVQFYRAANGLLSIPASPAVASVHRLLVKSADPQLQVVGLIGLVQQGDAASLEQVPQFQEAMSASILSTQMVLAVQHVRDGAPRTVEALGRLVTGPTVGVGIQAAAAEALRTIHTRESLPFLVAMLDSPSLKIRHQGLAGLSMFVLNLPIQTPEMGPSMTWLTPQGPAPYRTADTDRYSVAFGVEPEGRQAEYVTFWKGWWARMQNQLSMK